MFKYQLKTQSKLLKYSVIAVFLVLLLLITTIEEGSVWINSGLIVILIPSFLTTNIISDTYENSREGMLFTSKRPIYKQMLNRYLVNWIFTESLVTIVFLLGYLQGREARLVDILMWIVYSTFISVLGLTFSNIFKSSTLGQAVSVIVWGLSLAVGYQLNEDFKLISPTLNMYLKETVFWENITSVVIIIFLLMLFNVWYLGKGERIRGKVIGCLILSIFIIGSTFIYLNIIESKNNSVQYEIISDSENTVFVVSSSSDVVHKYLKENKIKYETKYTGEIEENKNVVYITDGSLELKKEKKVLVTNEGVKAGKIDVLNADAFRVLDGRKVTIASNNWTKEQLKLLLEEKKGNFIAIKGNKVLARSDYKTIDNLEQNLKLLSTEAYLQIENKNTKVMYHDMDYKDIGYISELWEVTYNVLNRDFKNIKTNTLEVFYRNDYSLETDDYYKFSLLNKMDFEGVRNGNVSLLRVLCSSIMKQTFEESNDERLAGNFIDYLYDTEIKHDIKEYLTDDYIERLNYVDYEIKTSKEDYYRDYTRTIKRRYDKIDRYSKKADNMARYMIYLVDLEVGLKEIVNGSNNISLEEILKLVESKEISEILVKYQNEIDKSENSTTGRVVRKLEN